MQGRRRRAAHADRRDRYMQLFKQHGRWNHCCDGTTASPRCTIVDETPRAPGNTGEHRECAEHAPVCGIAPSTNARGPHLPSYRPNRSRTERAHGPSSWPPGRGSYSPMTPGRAGSASPRRVVLQTPRKGPRARSEEHPTQAANATRRGKGDCGRAGAVGAFYPRGSLAPCVRKPPVRQRTRPPCKRPNRRPGKERGDPAGKRLIAGPERAASEKRPLRAKSRGPVRFTSPVIPRPTAGGTRLLALQDRRPDRHVPPHINTRHLRKGENQRQQPSPCARPTAGQSVRTSSCRRPRGRRKTSKRRNTADDEVATPMM